MKKYLAIFAIFIATTPKASALGTATAPWGWATCADESGTPYTLSGGCFSDANTVTLKALGNGQTDDTQIRQAIAQGDIIILDGSNGDFTIGQYVQLSAVKNKTIIGINDARLCTKFFLTEEDNQYLKSQNLDGLSSTDQYTGTLPDGTTLTCDKRAFFTKKALMELQYQKTGTYTLPDKAGIFSIGTSCENIIIRNLQLIGPGAVDIDGADLITNQGQHVWIDHCTFVDSQDGALDSKLCDWATYTYNHFYYTARSFSHAYTCGCGWVTNHSMVLHLTFGNNLWGEGCQRRLPQADDCYIHLVNNYHNCPGNSAGMTINSYSRALIENNYAAKGVNSILTGSGANRNITVTGNSFTATSVGSTVSVPYQYNKVEAAQVPALLTGSDGAGATLGDDASAILSTIPTVKRNETQESVYVITKDDPLIGSTISAESGLTLTFDPSVSDWKSGGSGSSAQTVDDVSLSGYYAVSANTSGAPVKLTTTRPGTLTIFLGGEVSTGKTLFMSDGTQGLTATVLSTDAHIDSGTKPATAIAAWDALVYTLDAGKTYTFYITGTKWRLAAFRYVSSSTPTAVKPSHVSTLSSHLPALTFDLQGRRVTHLRNGLYIREGKKVIQR